MRLPKSVQEIANVIGREKALRLVRQLPQCGKRDRRRNLYVPKLRNLTPDHRLVRLLGWEDAAALASEHGGRTLQPAPCRYLERALENRRILALQDFGYTCPEIAAELAISEKWAEAVLEARAMLDAGQSIEVIAHSVKISPLTIGYILGVDIGTTFEPIRRRSPVKPPSNQMTLSF